MKLVGFRLHCVIEEIGFLIPPLHISRISISPNIGDTGEHGDTREMIGNDTGRSGEKWGDRAKTTTPPIILARTGKTREDREEAGAIWETRE